MLIDRGIIKIGLEIEVAAWDSGRTYQLVAADLIDAEYMQGPPSIWAEWHTYHCSCKRGGCREIRRGDLIVPPLVSVTYDASLPATGGEFIMSPILLADGSSGMDDMHNIWDIVTEHAVWTMEGQNIHGGNVSPSVHLHVSATKTEEGSYYAQHYVSDIMHALELFSPELFALAELDIVNRRGLKYRLPNRYSIEYAEANHHGFIHVRSASPGRSVYIEWRLFEAAYNSWEYVQRSAYLAAVLTRALLDRQTLGNLTSRGYEPMYDDDQLDLAVKRDDLNLILAMVDRHRLDSLRQICLEQIDDDPIGFHILDDMFMKVENTVL